MSSRKLQNHSSSQYSCWPKTSLDNEELVEVTIPSQRSYTSPNNEKNQFYSSGILPKATTSHYTNSIYSESPDLYYDNTNPQLHSYYQENLSYNPCPEETLPSASGHTQAFRQNRVSNKKKGWVSNFSQPYHIPDQTSYKNLDVEESQSNIDSPPLLRDSNTRERRPRKQPHELLTESQKKANHIASEQKRRQNIRLGFEKLIDIVPSLNHGNKSEALILQKSVDHINYLLTMKNELKNQVRDLQSTLGESHLDEDSSDDEHIFQY